MTICAFDIPHCMDREARTCRAVVETPHGSRAKLNYDPETGLFVVKKLLPAGLAFPLDFGFIPSTKGGDGDALDVLILAEQALPPGCLATVRLLGAIEAEQTEKAEGGAEQTVRNDRIIARLAESRTFENVDGLDQLGEAFHKELETFFATYNGLRGIRFKAIGRVGPDGAVRLIEEGGKAA